MSGFGVDQGAGGTSAEVLRSTGEPGKASPIRRGGRIAKRIRKREPGKSVAVWSRITQGAWAACVRCGELSGAKVILSSLSETRMSPAVANSSSHLDALGNVAELIEQPVHASAGLAQLLAEPAMCDLEAPHGRPALFGVVRGGGTQFAFEPGQISAGRTDLLVQSVALRIGDGAGWVLRLDLVIDQRVDEELFAHVLEEVLLSPALEHAVSDLDVAQVPPAGDHCRLMAVVAQARDLPQAQPALDKTHGLIVQKIVHQALVELGATADEPPLIDATAPALTIGENVEAILDHRGEQFRAPAAAVEDDGDPSLANHLPHLSEQTGHGLRQRRIHLSGDHQ